ESSLGPSRSPTRRGERASPSWFPTTLGPSRELGNGWVRPSFRERESAQGVNAGQIKRAGPVYARGMTPRRHGDTEKNSHFLSVSPCLRGAFPRESGSGA